MNRRDNMYPENQCPTANSGLAVEQSTTGTFRKLSLRSKDNALSASIAKVLSSYYQQDDVDKRTPGSVACCPEETSSPEAPIAAAEDCSSIADQQPRGEEILAAEKEAAAARAEAEAKEVLLSMVTSERDENYRVMEKLRHQLRTVREQMTDENETLRAENDKLRSENAKAVKEARLAGEENRSVAADVTMMLSVVDSLRERIRVAEEAEQNRTRNGRTSEDSCARDGTPPANLVASKHSTSERNVDDFHTNNNCHRDQEYRKSEGNRSLSFAVQSMMADARVAAIAEELRLEREGHARRETEMEESMRSLGRQVDFLAVDNISLVKKLQRVVLAKKQAKEQQQPDVTTSRRETTARAGSSTIYSGASSSRPHEHQVPRRPSFTNSAFQKENSDLTVSDRQEPKKLQARE